MLVTHNADVTDDDLTLRRGRRILHGIVNARVLQHFTNLRGSDIRMFARQCLGSLPYQRFKRERSRWKQDRTAFLIHLIQLHPPQRGAPG